MFISKNCGFKRQYIYSSAGIFDSTANFFSRLLSSRTVEQLAKTALKEVATNAGRKLIERLLTPKLKAIPQKNKLAVKTQHILSEHSNNIGKSSTNTPSISALIDGFGTIAIQDLVKKVNGTRMKKM